MPAKRKHRDSSAISKRLPASVSLELALLVVRLAWRIPIVEHKGGIGQGYYYVAFCPLCFSTSEAAPSYGEAEASKVPHEGDCLSELSKELIGRFPELRKMACSEDADATHTGRAFFDATVARAESKEKKA